MWNKAFFDVDISETVNTFGPFNFHPVFIVEVGDVIKQSLCYAHPALTTPISRPLNALERARLNPRKEEYWEEVTKDFPKR